MNKMALYRLVALVLPVLLLAGAISPLSSTRRSQGMSTSSTWRIHSHVPAAHAHASLSLPPPRVPGIPPQVGLTPYSLLPRNVLGFFGSGFPANTWVNVRLGNPDGTRPVDRYSIWLGRAMTNAGGNLNGQVEVPLLPAGDYPVYFMPAGSQDSVIADLIIQALKPWVVLDDYAPSVHDWMGFQGRDFAPDEEVLIYLNQKSGQPVAHVQTDSYGNFTLNRVWQVPDLTGENTLIFVGKDSGVSFTASFTMMPPPPAQPTPPPPAQPTPAPAQHHSSPSREVKQQISIASGAAAGAIAVQFDSSIGAAAQRSSVLPGGMLPEASSTLVVGLLLLVVWVILVALLSIVLMVRRADRHATYHSGKGASALSMQNSASTQAEPGAPSVPASATLASPSKARRNELLQRGHFCPRCGWPGAPEKSLSPAFNDRSTRSGLPALPRKTPARLAIHREIPPTVGMWVSAASDCGRKRTGRINEDNFLAVRGTRKDHDCLQPLGLFVVADGMGARSNGHDASRIVIETIFHYVAPALTENDLRSDDLVLLLEEAIQNANETLYRHNQQGNAYMGCTLTATLVAGNEALICNVGDSRTYLLTAQQPLRRVTVDHSIVESLVAAGAIQREDVYTHPRRDRIYRSLGQRLVVQIDVFREPLAAGDELLLCCDGLWEMLRDPVIESLLRQYPDVSQASSKLIERANENGGDDNITVLVVKMTDEVKPARRPGIESIDSGPANLSHPGFAGFFARKRP